MNEGREAYYSWPWHELDQVDDETILKSMQWLALPKTDGHIALAKMKEKLTKLGRIDLLVTAKLLGYI